MSGTGTHVTETEGHVEIQLFDPNTQQVTNAVTIVNQKFEDVMAYAQTMEAQVQAILLTLQNQIATFTLPATWQDALLAVNIPSIDAFSMQAQTFLGTLVLPNNWPTNFPNLPALAPPPPIDMSYTAPTPPAAINPTINYISGQFNSDIYLSLFLSIYNQLTSGGYGLTTQVEEAIMARRQEAQRLSNAKKYTDDMRAAGATGFNFPGGVVAGICVDSTTEVLKQDTDFNNAVMIASLEASQKNYALAMEKGTTLEQILREFYNNTENRSLEVQKATGDLIVRVYAERVREFIAEWQGVKDGLDVKLGQLDMVIKSNTLLIDAFKAQADGFKTQTEAVKAETEGLVAGFRGQVDAYVAETQALSSYYNVIAESDKVQVEVAKLALQKAIAEMDATLKATLGIYELDEKIADTIGRIAEQAVASALNAVNASASIGLSGSAQVSESWHHADSLSESHEFQEDPTS